MLELMLGIAWLAIGWAIGYSTGRLIGQSLNPVRIRTKTEELYPKKHDDQNN